MDGLPASGNAVGIALYDAFSARGELRLTSADPEAQPVVDENMLAVRGTGCACRDGVRRLARLTLLSLARLAGEISSAKAVWPCPPPPPAGDGWMLPSCWPRRAISSTLPAPAG